jgi:hypothetical protein
MGHRQLLIIVLFDVAIAFAIVRVAGPREGRGLAYFALSGVVGLPFAFIAAAPFFLSSTQLAVAPSPAGVAGCPPAARTSASGLAVGQLRVVPGWVAGSVDVSHILGNTAYFCGWAASVKDRRAADAVVVFADERPAGTVKPTISRPDVARSVGPFGRNSGFSIQLPLSALGPRKQKAHVQILGLERGTASPLPFHCAGEPHDFGC